MNPLNYLPQFVGLILFLGGVPAFIFMYQYSKDLNLSIIIALLYEVLVIICAFFYKVWQKVEGQWTERLAEKIDLSVQYFLSGYWRRYRQYMVYQHRSFDVKGLTTQGPYNLDLDKVFVQLSIDPTPVHNANANPIPELPGELQKGRHSIWEYINAPRSNSRRLVILGAPGSGKTTLLKHIALALSSSPWQRRKVGAPGLLPILLFLRDHSKTINDKPSVTLEELILDHLKKRQMPIPPKGWFEYQLTKGRCLVMLDGLDEVANDQDRQQVTSWIEQRIASFGKNIFLITSRPHGYRSTPLNGVNILQVRPFTSEQVHKFVHNWYLANEIMSSKKDDPGVQSAAKQGAEDLLLRLRSMPTLTQLAVNPLLLTMISTVHRYRSSLPGRRVELYAEICEVFLGKRRAASGLVDQLTPAQKIRVLRELAFHLMQNQKREIESNDAVRVIANALEAVSPEIGGLDFLQMIEAGSGLLVEKENNQYSFSHLTFQEYLAAVHIIEGRFDSYLLSQVNNIWWHEAIRLYCAMTNASSIIHKCLEINTAQSISLAIACVNEAREVSPAVRALYLSSIQEGAEDPGERGRLIAQALLIDRTR